MRARSWLFLDRAALHRDQQIGERENLSQRNHDARDENDQRQRPRARLVQEDHAADDGVEFGRSQRRRAEHRQGVGRYVADRRCDQQRPSVLDRVVASPHQPARRSAGSIRGCARRRAARVGRRSGTRRFRPGRRSTSRQLIELLRHAIRYPRAERRRSVGPLDPRPDLARVEAHEDRSQQHARRRPPHTSRCPE